MDRPVMLEPYKVAKDIDVLPAYFPIPVLGIIPVNAFVLRAAEPVLVDTGLVPLSGEFMEKLSSVIDPGDLRWLWLTHTDQDHIGSLWQVLEQASKIRVITNYLGLGRMALSRPLPPDRVFLLNPGQSIEVGDRTLKAIRPPTYDAPETTGFFDPKTDAFFCADCFGALMSEPAENATDIGDDALQKGLSTWATVDAPWLHMLDTVLFGTVLDCVRDLSPRFIMSSHLPPAENMIDKLLGYLVEVPDMEPFFGPDQQAFDSMLKGMRGT